MTLAMGEVIPSDPAQPMQHCAEYDDAGADCSCCSGSEMIGVICASQCTTATAVSVASLGVVPQTSTAFAITVQTWTAGPIYSPLNPPPIV